MPGANLYFMVLGAITSNPEMFRAQGIIMILLAGSIAMGYITVDVAVRLFRMISAKKFTGR